MKKSQLLLFTCFIFSLILNGQSPPLNFQDLDSMNAGRGAIASATDGNFIYVSCGYGASGPYTTEIEKYDIANNTWTVFTNCLVGKRYASSAIVGNNLYVFDGFNGTSMNNKTEVVNLATGSVGYSTDNPAPVSDGGVAVWNGIIYAFGGGLTTTTYSNKLYKFDPVSQVWTALANMPEAKLTKGEIINGKLYTFGGYNGVPNNSMHAYDILTDSWTSLGTMTDSISANATAVNGSEIMIVNDYTKLTYLASYNVATGNYSVLNNNMIGRRHAGAEAINSKLYIFGGNPIPAITSSLKSLQVADLTTVGVNEIKNSNINIYPNPAANFLTIDGLKENAKAFIYDLKGNLLPNKKITNQIDISSLPAGIYSIRIEDDNKTFSYRFEKE